MLLLLSLLLLFLLLLLLLLLWLWLLLRSIGDRGDPVVQCLQLSDKSRLLSGKFHLCMLETFEARENGKRKGSERTAWSRAQTSALSESRRAVCSSVSPEATCASWWSSTTRKYARATFGGTAAITAFAAELLLIFPACARLKR